LLVQQNHFSVSSYNFRSFNKTVFFVQIIQATIYR